jgi:hypothetical protein
MGKMVTDLHSVRFRDNTRSRSALLAAVLSNPLRLKADRPSTYVEGRRAWILQQMGQLRGPTFIKRFGPTQVPGPKIQKKRVMRNRPQILKDGLNCIPVTRRDSGNC